MNKEQLYCNPANVLREFMEAWLYQNYDQMYTLVNKAWGSNHSRDFLWDMYSGIIIDDYAITEEPPRPERPMVTAEVKIKLNGIWLKPANINLVCETAPYRPGLHGEWGVNPVSTLKLIQRSPTRKERRKAKREQKKKK
jgi:hypothetical protein